jgi:AcrR family transcriptional regulator
MTVTAELAEDLPPRRERILRAAMGLFMERGYARTSTLAIASAAKVSKRDLYGEFAGKRDILVTCVARGAGEMRAALDLPRPRDRAALAALLVRFGIALRRGLADPKVVALFRLAVQEATAAPEVAGILHEVGRQASFAAVVTLLAAAQADGLLGPGTPEDMARVFMSVLVADMMVQQLLGIAPPEDETHAAEHANLAANTLLRVYGV